MDIATLKQRQSLPLAQKVLLAKRRIREFYQHMEGRVYVAFSGGRDSTVMLDIVRECYPGVPAVFVDTGLEYPEVREFARSFENVHTVRPAMNFKRVIEHYGYPVVSKRVAQYVHEVQRAKGETATKRLRLTGIKTNGEFSPMGRIPKKWQALCAAPFKVSDRCCNVMKKKPMQEAQRRFGAPFVGTMAADSNQRLLMYLKNGCNSFETKNPRSMPLGCWSGKDVQDYIVERGLAVSAAYAPPINCNSTGCMFCMFGVHLEPEPNRFQRMKKTHPKQWKYCMEVLGLRPVLEFIGVACEEPPHLFNQGENA